MASYVATLTVDGSTSDQNSRTIRATRSDSESLSSSQSVSRFTRYERNPTEYLNFDGVAEFPSVSIYPSGSIYPSLSGHFVTDSIARVSRFSRFYAEAIVEGFFPQSVQYPNAELYPSTPETQTTTDSPSYSLSLTFNKSETSTTTTSTSRSHGVGRSLTDTVGPATIASSHRRGYSAAQTEIPHITDSVTRSGIVLARSLSESHSVSDALHYVFAAKRQYIEDFTVTTHLTTGGHSVRSAVESLSLGLTTRRSVGVHRLITQTDATNAVLASLPNHPRDVTETLTLSDNAGYTLLAPVMGYLWYDSEDTQTVIAQLPNWTFVLVEVTPQDFLYPGNTYPSDYLLPQESYDSLYYAPMQSTWRDLMREK